jgi:hypothetical protein
MKHNQTGQPARLWGRRARLGHPPSSPSENGEDVITNDLDLAEFRDILELSLSPEQRLLLKIARGQNKIMADIAALTAALEEVKASAEVASEAVLLALAAASSEIAELRAQIDALIADAVSQEAIDALAAKALEVDGIVDSITAAVQPPV